MKTAFWIAAALAASFLGPFGQEAGDEQKKPEEDPDAIFLLCARDGTENRLKRTDLEKWRSPADLPRCAGGDHRLERVKCPRDGAENQLLETGGARREQCLQDGASLILLPVDRGPDRLDAEALKALSEDMRSRYDLMAERCSKCHTLARPLNSAGSRIQGADWQKYIKKMLRRPGSGITEEEGKRIYGFLKPYSEERAKKLEEEARKKGEGKKDGP